MKSLVLAALIVLANDASAKCVFDWYAIAGKIGTSSAASIPVATITASWRDEYGDHTAVARTVGDGSYLVKLAFSTFSGPGILKHSCDAKLEMIDLHVSASGYKTVVKIVKFNGSRAYSDVVLQRRAPH